MYWEARSRRTPWHMVTRVSQVDFEYVKLIRKILDEGVPSNDRTGVGTVGIFGYQMQLDLRDGFPLLSLKKIHWKSVVVELLWMLRGDTNTKYLRDHGVTIWDDWADDEMDLGPVYGAQWRDWWVNYGESVDQVAVLLNQMQINPESRRHILSAWNVAEIDEMALPPCHMMAQFYVRNGELSCSMYQRSVDTFLGLPFNIASYALLTHIFAAAVGLKVGKLVWTGGDVHIYNNHTEQVNELLCRCPARYATADRGGAWHWIDSDPKLVIDHPITPATVLRNELEPGWFRIENYNPLPAIKAPVAV